MRTFARSVLRCRIPIIVFTGILTLAAAFFMRDIKINADIMSYLPKGDAVAELNTHISEVYGGSYMAVVAVESENLFSQPVIDAIAQMTEDISLIEGIMQVTSVANALDIRKTHDGFSVGKLIEEEDGKLLPLAAVRERALTHPLFKGRIVSEDGKATIIVARLSDTRDKALVASEIRDIALAQRVEGMRLSFAGLPFQLSEITNIVKHDVLRLVPIAAILIALSLALSFRSLRGLILPLAAVGIATVWTVGLMCALKIPFSVVTNVIPVVLLSAGSAYTIHVLSTFSEAHEKGAQSYEGALADVAVPVVLAAATTIAGFVSFIFGSYLTMIAQFGIFSAVGILFSVIVSLTFIPAVLSYLPPQKQKAGKDKKSEGMWDRLSHRYVGFVLAHHRIMLLVTLAVVVVGLLGIPLVRREVDVMSYYKEGTDIRKAEALLKEKFGGSSTINILVRGDIKNPETLREMREMENFLKGQEGVKNPHSIVELIEEMNWVISDKREIPQTAEEVGNLWFLIEGEESLSQLVASDTEEGLITANIESINSGRIETLVTDVDSFIAQKGFTAEFIQNGAPALYYRIDMSIAKSQIASLLIAGILMLAANVILLRSLKIGTVGMIPVVFTLFILFGSMGYFRIPLDIATVLIGSISLGMGIDYSLHFLNRFKREFAEDGNLDRSLEATLHTTGKAIVINAVTVAVGFLALFAGDFLPLRRFGYLISIAMVSSALAAMAALPAVLRAVKLRENGKKSLNA